jgi:hypothetical protein
VLLDASCIERWAKCVVGGVSGTLVVSRVGRNVLWDASCIERWAKCVVGSVSGTLVDMLLV